MKFLIIGIVCTIFGIVARTNPEIIRSFLNSGAEMTPDELSRMQTAGTINLVCGILLIILGIITLIVEAKRNKK